MLQGQNIDFVRHTSAIYRFNYFLKIEDYPSANAMEEFLIPIDDAIEAFRHHLDAHDRTILSARFGDGKSFFLSHFMENEDVAERYTFLTIFPVNYQVTENHDIFDLIKRDILLQMLLKGVMETDIQITTDEALSLYLQCKPLSFIESFLPLLSEFSLPEDAVKAAAVAAACKKVFKTIKKKIEGVKQLNRDAKIERFLNSVEQNPIVAQDVISNIIHRGIEEYKKKFPTKKVVLVIEDLDRIDPSHLFRILNIFSAHIDFCYRQGSKPDETLAGNKFGLDKVVFVMHYENVKNIYSHFYGPDTSFEGYIDKFCSSNHFNYSLQEERDSYFNKQISQETGLPVNVLSYIIKPDDFNGMTIRKVVHALENNADFVISITRAKNREGQSIPLHQGILRLIAILRKLGIKDDDIVSRIRNAIVNKNSSVSGIMLYVAPYLTLLNYSNSLADFRYAKATDMPNYISVENIDDEGKAVCSFSISYNDEVNAELNLQKQLEKLLLLVAR